MIITNIRETLKNDKDTGSNNTKSSTDSSQNKSKTKSMYSRKSFKRGAGIVIK